MDCADVEQLEEEIQIYKDNFEEQLSKVDENFMSI